MELITRYVGFDIDTFTAPIPPYHRGCVRNPSGNVIHSFSSRAEPWILTYRAPGLFPGTYRIELEEEVAHG